MNNLYIHQFKMELQIYISKVFLRWKLAGGMNDDCSDRVWSQMKPAEKKANVV